MESLLQVGDAAEVDVPEPGLAATAGPTVRLRSARLAPDGGVAAQVPVQPTSEVEDGGEMRVSHKILSTAKRDHNMALRSSFKHFVAPPPPLDPVVLGIACTLMQCVQEDDGLTDTADRAKKGKGGRLRRARRRQRRN